MESAGLRSRRWLVLMVLCGIVAVRLLTTAAGFHLAIIAVSTVMAASMALTAVIAVTGRNLW